MLLKKVSGFFLFICLFSAQHCLCEESSLDLGRIIVTPFRTDVALSANPASLDIIELDGKTTAGMLSFTEAVRSLPSVAVATTGGKGGDTALFIRGADSDHTQVLLDGIKLYDPISTSAYFYGYNYMSADNLERIEVVKGPYSSLYGSDSIGGTVNLISKKGKGEPGLSYTQTMGSFQTFKELLRGQGEKNDLAWFFSVARTDINAFYSGRYKDGNYETDPYHGTNASLRLDYELSEDTHLGLITDYSWAKYEYDASGGSDNDEYYAYFNQGVAGLNLDQTLSDRFKHKIITGYTRTYRKDWSWGSSSFYNGITYQAKWQGEVSLTDWWKSVTGFDYLREQGESTWSAKKTANTRGYFLEQILTPLDNFFVSATCRSEDHSRFKQHEVYNLGASYRIEKTGTKLKSSWGEGFKAPSLYQLFSPYGSPDLNPEKSESYEFGLDQELGDKLVLETTYFNTEVKDLIQYRSLGVPPWGEYYQENSRARISGWENLVTWKPDTSLSLSLGYTAMETKNKDTGSRLERRPENKLSLSINKKLDKLTVSSLISYTGNRIDGAEKLKSYYLASISAVYQINERWESFLRAENLFDQEYETVNGYETPGLSLYTGVKVSF